MKHAPVQLVLLFLSLFFSNDAFSQLKEGFSKLKKGDYEAANAIFQRDYPEPAEQFGAEWGAIQLLGTPDYQKHHYNSACLSADSLAKKLKELRNRNLKEELSDKYDLNISAITAFKKTLLEPRWKEVEDERTLRSVDSFILIFKKPKKQIADASKKLRNTLRLEALKNWSTYEDLKYLYAGADTSHYNWLRDSLPREFERIENALLPAFWKDGHKIAEIGLFFNDLKMHPLTNHAAAPAFRAAAESGRLKNLLAFELAKPRTPFSPYSRSEIRRIYGEKTPSEAELANLTRDEHNLLDDILDGPVDCYAEFTGADTSAWFRYIERRASGSPCGKRNLENMLGYYFKNKQWKDASYLLKRFKPLFPTEKERYDELIILLDEPETGDSPKPAGENINTANGSEYIPLLTPDGKHLYFCAQSRKDNIGREDIYFSKWADGKWQPAKLIPELCTKQYSEAPLSFTADGNQMIYFSDGKPFVSNRSEAGWSPGVALAIDLNKFNWVGKVQVAPNNRFAIFEAKTDNDPDFYIVFKSDDDQWQTPVRLDSTINTPAPERWPCLHPDMKHLYFSSAGHTGFGDQDVFVSTRLDDTWMNWSKPVNLGKMINTPDQDWGYSITPDGRTAWFSRGDKRAEKQDIFSVQLPKAAWSEVPQEVEALITDVNSNPLNGAEITVYLAETSEKIGSYRTGAKSGKSFFYIEKGKSVLFSAYKDGYFPKSVKVDLKKLPADSVAKVHIMLSAMKAEGDTVNLLSDVFFETGKWEINPGMKAELKILGDYLRRHSFDIELSGHTDNTGNETDNQILSERRAEAVRILLISVGVPEDKIKVKGFGESQPACQDDTPGCKAKNRRVEIRWHK